MKFTAAISAFVLASLASSVTAAGPSGSGKSSVVLQAARSAATIMHERSMLTFPPCFDCIPVVAPVGGTVVHNGQRYQDGAVAIEYNCIARIKPDTATTLGIKVSLEQGSSTHVVSLEWTTARTQGRCCRCPVEGGG